MRLHKRHSTLLVALLLTTGCGQLGPLYLPEVAPPAPETSQDNPEQAEEES